MALAILDDVGFGAVTNKWLKNIAQHEGIPFNDTIENDIGLRVIKEHIFEATDDGKNNKGTAPYSLSAPQVSEYRPRSLKRSIFPSIPLAVHHLKIAHIQDTQNSHAQFFKRWSAIPRPDSGTGGRLLGAVRATFNARGCS